MQRTATMGIVLRPSTTKALCLGLLVGTFSAGCEEDPPRETLPEWTTPDDTGADTTGNPLVLGEFEIALPLDINYPARLRKTGSVDDPCSVKPDGTPEGYVDIDCTIDIPELDLFANGISWDWFVPAGACEFVSWSHYMYETFEWGTGPTQVVVEVVNGQIVNQVNAVGGVPYCQYDYSPLGPSCCIGTYTYTFTVDGETTVAGPINWGGDLPSCHGGAAYHDPEAEFDQLGFPFDKIVYLQRSAWSKQFEFPALTGSYYSNVPLANVYNPADHGGGPPAGLQRTRGDFTGYAQPVYTFECLDHAEEKLAEIRLQVQEYNTQDAYFDDGNPNEVGVEPVTGEPLDDRDDWATATPGPDLYLGFFE